MSVNMNKVALVHAEIKALDAAMESLATERKAKVARLVTLNGGESNTGKVTLPDGSFTVSENNTYPDEAIRAALTEGQAKRCEKRVLDKAKVKALYPNVYAAAKVQNGVKVTVA
jgi:hypothetical protein